MPVEPILETEISNDKTTIFRERVNGRTCVDKKGAHKRAFCVNSVFLIKGENLFPFQRDEKLLILSGFNRFFKLLSP